ncbi:hypothetical protein GQ53DRAFT_855821 [Thozetella sp. PMI_491]|nr:hypothetical protein GQ53DRAFT_855821 [Thozetella sp. PMI_491]
MDAIHAADLACYISLFAVSAATALSVFRPIEESSNVADGAALLSDEDELFLRLVAQCQKLSSKVLLSLQQAKDRNPDALLTKTQPTENGNDFQLLDSIREDLNEHIARHQWSSLSQTIREVRAKNSRLGANRTTEIDELASSLDASFREIESKGVKDERKLASWHNVRIAAQKTADYEAEQIILSTLQFWTMDRRKESIAKEHENTFEWVLAQEPSEGSSEPPSNFGNWLGSDEPLYWISGKPGSGKSTLMKFIAENQKTLDGLRRWAKDDTLITAGFYFWSSAKDPLQKSDTGLLRSILFQILRQCPDLIKHAYPEQWQDRQSQGTMQRFARELPISDLLAAYQRISALLSTTRVKFCFFIDGLDEYDGEPADVIRLIESLSKTGNLKTCISSRQWTEFEAIFGGQNPWKLYVHQLTYGDMRLYVEDLLNKDRRFCKLKENAEEGSVQSLMGSIVENAEGVFLWVLLVVRSLLDSLTDADQIADLQHRLTAIPNDLDQYFDKMFLDIEPHMREQTAEIFRVTLEAAEKLPLMCYWLIREETLEAVSKMKLQSLGQDVAKERLTSMEKWLNTYSRGLLTAKGEAPEGGPSPGLEEYQWLFEFRVDFLHRTVADFLRTAHTTRMLEKWSAPSFNVDFEICKACLATLKASPPTSAMFKDAPRAPSVLHLLMSHAKLLEGESRVQLLDVCVDTLGEHAKVTEEIPSLILGPGNYWAYGSSFNFMMLYHCVSYGLGDYVSLQLDRGALQFSEPPSALLTGCFSWDPRVRVGKFTLDLETIELLLRRGLDPNLAWGDRGFSCWQQLVTSTYSKHLKGMVSQADCDAIRSAIEHGADLEASVENTSTDCSGLDL